MAKISSNSIAFLAIDDNAEAVAGALLYVYAAGTTNPVTTYTDAALSIAHPSPIVANAAGKFPAIYVANGFYKVDIQTPLGVSLPGYPEDNVAVQNTISAAGLDLLDDADAAAQRATLGLTDAFTEAAATLKDVTTLLADTGLTYTAGADGTVAAGDIIRTRSEGFSYQVVASAATDQHVTTAGGVKLKVLPGPRGASLKAFGAVGDGVTDDTTAVSVWLDMLIATQAEGIAPPGTFLCTSAIAKTFTGISHLVIHGAGSEHTIFLFSAATSIDGFSFTAADGNWWFDVSPGTGYHFSGFAIATTNANGGTGLLLDNGSVEGRPQRKNNLNDITFRGRSSFDHNWNIHCDLLDAGSTWFWGCRWIMGGPTNTTGVGCRVRATDATTDPTSIHFANCVAVYGFKWLEIQDHVEGVYVTQCEHVGGQIGIGMLVTAESGLHILGGHYNNTAFNFDLAGVFDFEIADSLLYLNNSSGVMYGIRLNGCGRGTITGNAIIGTNTATQVGIWVENSIAEARMGVTISGNQISSMSNNGITLTGTAQYVTVGANGYGQIAGHNVKNDGTNNIIQPLPGKVAAWNESVVKTVGAGTSETVNFTFPAGIFSTKPRVVQVSASGQPIIGNYDFDNAGNSETNAVVVIQRYDGGALPNGGVRFQISAVQ